MDQDDPVMTAETDSFDDEDFTLLAKDELEALQAEMGEQRRQNYLKHFSYDLDEE